MQGPAGSVAGLTDGEDRKRDQQRGHDRHGMWELQSAAGAAQRLAPPAAPRRWALAGERLGKVRAPAADNRPHAKRVDDWLQQVLERQCEDKWKQRRSEKVEDAAKCGDGEQAKRCCAPTLLHLRLLCCEAPVEM